MKPFLGDDVSTGEAEAPGHPGQPPPPGRRGGLAEPRHQLTSAEPAEEDAVRVVLGRGLGGGERERVLVLPPGAGGAAEAGQPVQEPEAGGAEAELGAGLGLVLVVASCAGETCRGQGEAGRQVLG